MPGVSDDHGSNKRLIMKQFFLIACLSLVGCLTGKMSAEGITHADDAPHRHTFEHDGHSGSEIPHTHHLELSHPDGKKELVQAYSISQGPGRHTHGFIHLEHAGSDAGHKHDITIKHEENLTAHSTDHLHSFRHSGHEGSDLPHTHVVTLRHPDGTEGHSIAHATTTSSGEHSHVFGDIAHKGSRETHTHNIVVDGAEHFAPTTHEETVPAKT